MTNTRKTPATATAAEPDTTASTAPTEAAETPLTVVGPPLRHGQKPETVTLAHHLRIGNEEYRPGQTAIVSPEYARQLRRNGYIARG
ncbi:hypothetical protein AB0H51_28370 [Streptomyces griseoluteus]|uniref:hypothetical protein n=1 Tax=Streptomyces griseoluteus TaxID=29306 RepID=UPI0033E0BFCE